MVEFPPYRLDLRAGRLWRGTRPVELRPKAWALLCYLVERADLLVTKEDLHQAVWGDVIVSDDTLTRTLGELRQALGDSARRPRIIETVHRRGFRFIGQFHHSVDEGLTPGSSTTPPGDSAGPTSALVGRDQELARLGALFRQASAGQRQIVFIEGEPGIGKSALVQAFLGTVRAPGGGVLIGYGQCVEQYGQQEPYMAVLEALERLSDGSSGEAVRSALRAVAPSWLAQMPSLLKPSEEEWLRRGHADTTPHRMLREFAGLAETVSREHPLLLVLEDLHWSDQGTVDLLSVLAQRPERARMMLVGTYRPAQAAALDHPIQQVRTLLRSRGRCTILALEYLRPDDVAAYLARRLPDARVAPDVVAVVHARTDGNPLFMVVLVDHLVSRGWLARDGSVWRLTTSRSTIEQEVPDNLRQLIEGQLRFVAPEERDVLEVASVAGVVFDAPAVAAGVGAPADQVESICHGLCSAHGWLHHVDSRAWPDGALATRYAFRHALYQRTLYDRLSPSRRASLHERIGRRLETGYAGRTVEAAGELAKHFQIGRDQSRTLIYLEQAAIRAYERRAYGDVIACLEPALRLAGDLPATSAQARDELRLRRMYAIVLSQTAGYASKALLENLQRTQALAEQLEDSPALFDALCGLLLQHANKGDLVRAEDLADQLSPIAERQDASAALQCQFLRGSVALWRGKLSAAASFFIRALSSGSALPEADRPYGANPVVAARAFEGFRRWVVGDLDGASVVQAEALTLAEQHGRPFTIAQAATLGARVLFLEGRAAEARALASKAIEIADEYGFPRWRGGALVIRGGALVEQGEGARGLGEIREGLNVLRAVGIRLGDSVQLSILAGACLRMHRVDEGLAAVNEGLAYCRESGERLFESELWRLRGELRRRQGPRGRSTRAAALADAEACFDRARAVARAQGARMLEERAGRPEARVARVRRAASS
ncbi:MAG TPA: AAA family ATPase [Candidatus Bathyarchaeia archaeon]|nr:AAA family ATPase [Candidatus Bathyarchaeia archaeon]